MAASRLLLLIVDDVALRTALAEQLELHGEFGVVTTGGAAGLAAAAEQAFDMILVDADLADRPGGRLCQDLRLAGLRTPIILLTRPDDAPPGPAAGASDHLAKPVKLGQLLGRMRIHLRQHEQSDDADVMIGPYTFRAAARVLVDNDRGGQQVRLTDKEAAILKYLYRAGDRPVPRETLLAEVWGYNQGVSTHTLETHIYRLRQKIEPDPSNARLLVTESGGYRLVA
jgi:DNA-binding response OmpR family regulator